MAKYTITYSVELNVPEEAYYWHDKAIRDSTIQLPEHVYWVNTMPEIQRIK